MRSTIYLSTLPRQLYFDIEEVMSRGCRGAAADCVRLQSSDGDTFEVSLKVAKLSRTIETMLRGEYVLHSRSLALVH